MLFPDDPVVERDGALDVSGYNAALEQQAKEVHRLAGVLSSDDPDVVANRISRFDREAAAAECSWPRHTPLLAGEIAKLSNRSKAWLQATIDAECAADIVTPFLMATIQTSHTSGDWEDLVGRCLDQPALIVAAVYALITQPDPPEILLDRAVKAAVPFDSLVEELCWHGSVPSKTLRLLLSHDGNAIAGAAAMGEWMSPNHPVRTECAQEWQAAMLRTPDGNHKRMHTLGRILRSDPILARDWLLERMIRGERFHFIYPEAPVNHAIAVLDAEARWAVLSAVSNFWGAERFIAALVGDDLELFSRWLSVPLDANCRLAPLGGRPTGTWVAKAKIAYRAGLQVSAIVNSTFSNSHFWSGEESDYWAGWEQDFDALCSNEDSEIVRIAERGRKTAAERRAAAVTAERREDIYGTR